MYEDNLKPYAMTSKKSKGREVFEGENINIFLLDKERILQSKSWRRMQDKTQVFINNSGDHLRNRLSHSLEVANSAKIVSRGLGINEDLAECVGLAHDLGHSPFGHAGEGALNSEMANYSGFEHNYQSVRVVTELESVDPNLNGLNLSHEVIEGLIKHKKPREMIKVGKFKEYNLFDPATLEAQVANFVDEPTYNCHDLDDGYRSGLISLKQLMEIPIFSKHIKLIKSPLTDDNAVIETIRRIKKELLNNIIETTQRNIDKAGIKSIADILNFGKDGSDFGKNLVSFSSEFRQYNGEIKKFLHRNLYFKVDMERRNNLSQVVIKGLFQTFMKNSNLLPDKYQVKIPTKVAKHGEEGKARVISDYISGMTDEFAIEEYRQLFIS